MSLLSVDMAVAKMDSGRKTNIKLKLYQDGSEKIPPSDATCDLVRSRGRKSVSTHKSKLGDSHHLICPSWFQTLPLC